MFEITVDTTPWRCQDVAPSHVLQESPEDWLSCFDFGNLQPSSSTQEANDLTQLLDYDISDLLLPSPIENLLPFNPFDALSPILEPERDGDTEESMTFSSVFELNGSANHQISESTLAESNHVEIVTQEPAGGCSLPRKSNSSMVSSPHDSDAGSSLAAREGGSFDKENCVDNNLSSHVSVLKDGKSRSAASSRKRPYEDTGSDLDGGGKEGRSLSDPSDKRQQRLLRNRELAFESRQRKKCYVSDLEAKCRMLEQERNQLQQQLCFATAENVVLQKELSRVKNTKGKDGVAEPAVLFKDSLPLEFLSLLICLLLTAQLSLCVSPFLGLVLRATLFFLSPTKVGGLGEEQVLSKRYFVPMGYHVNWLLHRLWYHMLLEDRGLSTVVQKQWVPNLRMQRSACNFVRASIRYLQVR